MDPLVDGLTHFGLPGIFCAVMLVLYLRKDAQLKSESAARIEDAKAATKVLLEVQERALATANKLSDVFQELRQQYPPPRRST